jgi:YVTN family beta-propeller protein
MRLKRITYLSGATIAGRGYVVGASTVFLLLAATGSVQADAQTGPSATVANRTVTPAQIVAWYAQRHLRPSSQDNTARPSRISAADASNHFRNPTAPTVNVGGNPTDVAADPDNQTAYVTNSNDGTVSLVNTATCRAGSTSGCSQVAPTVAVESFPVADVYDPQTHTVYVTNVGSATVSMINTTTCNATTQVGCGAVPTVHVGYAPDFDDVNTTTQTLYVVDAYDSTVSVINAATCNATTSSGCDQVSTVAVGFVPTGLAVDASNHTVYVATGLGLNTPGSVSMINAATCNAQVRSGCSRVPRTVAASIGAAWVAVNSSTHTVYVSTGPSGEPAGVLGSADVINADTCNATVTSGCRKTPLTVTVGSVGAGIVADSTTNSVFVVNEEDSTVSVIDGTTCHAGSTSGCSQNPPTVAVGFDPGTLGVDLSTGTVYVPNQNENTVSVLNGAACSLVHRAGCREPAPTTSVGFAPSGVAVNATTDTVYVTDRGDNDLAVVKAATCNANNSSGCAGPWPTVATGVGPQVVAVDQLTDTIYTGNTGPNDDQSGTTVSVIDGATCNTHVTSGCGRAPATVFIGSPPEALAVNEATDTIYVADGNTDTVSVIDGATCNATNHSGCSLAPATITVGAGPDGMAVNQATDTVYVANGGVTGPGDTVSVIDGAICNALTTSGCGQVPPSVLVGNGPSGVAVDTSTDTVYVTDGDDNTISVINGATCNATNHTGCGQSPPTMATSTGPGANLAIDQSDNAVFVGSVIESEVDIFNGSGCDATVISGCGQVPKTVPVGGYPGYVAVDGSTHTLYTPDNTDDEVSFFGFFKGVTSP